VDSTKQFTLDEILNRITPETARAWMAGEGTLTGDPEMEQFLSEAQNDQEIWDATVLCAFETTTGIDGVLNYEVFEEWLDTPAAHPALAALKSARAGHWISPQNYQDAAAFWGTVAKANA
jgi:hypothetical protein